MVRVSKAIFSAFRGKFKRNRSIIFVGSLINNKSNKNLTSLPEILRNSWNSKSFSLFICSEMVIIKGVPGIVFAKTVLTGLACTFIGSSIVHHFLKPLADLDDLVQKELAQRKKCAAAALASQNAEL